MNQTGRILEEVKKAVCGKDHVLVWVLTVLLARGHVLLEDIPGVGKTTMALAFSRALFSAGRRIAVRIAMIAITTRSSTRVKFENLLFFFMIPSFPGLFSCYYRLFYKKCLWTEIGKTWNFLSKTSNHETNRIIWPVV